MATYCLMLADDALVLSQRLTEWCSRAPELEEDVALANIALDLLGQARLLLSRAGEVEGAGRDEDALAYLRDEHEFRNVRLVEIDCGPGPGGDFATTIARLLVFSTWRLAVLSQLASSVDPVLAAIAAKGVKELAYHRDHAAQWTLRLGGGTELSRERMVAGLERVWPLVPSCSPPTRSRSGCRAWRSTRPPSGPKWTRCWTRCSPRPGWTGRTCRRWPRSAGRAGRDGVHTEALGYLLAEMQHLARSLPGAVW